MRLLAAVLGLIALTSPAVAACPSAPDDKDSAYTENATARMLCLQRELAIDTEQQAQRAQLEAELNRLQLDLQRQQQFQLQQWSMNPVWPTVP